VEIKRESAGNFLEVVKIDMNAQMVWRRRRAEIKDLLETLEI
jgi:hypothetical protein